MKQQICLLLACTALVSATGALASPTKKVGPAAPPAPYSGAYQPQGVDEIGLWREDDERERRLANSPLVIKDEALNAYVRNVICITVGSDRCQSVRPYIVRLPLFNASMSPNGMMRIYTGLLLRARNESELAAVLGHEFGHFERRHSLERFKALRKGTDILSWAAVLAIGAGTQDAARAYQDLETSVIGGLMRFSRDNEREADLLGLGYLNTGKLRPHSASTIWRNLILEAESSAAARGLRKPDFNQNTFFASHPVEGERADYLYALAAPDGEGRDEGAARYSAALAAWLPLFLDDQIKLNDFGASEFIINRHGEAGWTATLWRARGDLFRSRGNQRDLMNAAEYYGKAVSLDPSLAAAQRGLGLSLIKTGRITEGRAALERYLLLEHDASDAAMIKLTIASTGEAK